MGEKLLTREDLLDEISSVILGSRDTKKENEFTAREIVNDLNRRGKSISVYRVYDYLEKCIKDETMVTRKAIVNGRDINVYSKKGD